MELFTGNLKSINKTIDRFAEEGQRIARKYKKGAVLEASVMSKLLRDNFKRELESFEVGDQVQHERYGKGHVIAKLESDPRGMVLVLFERTRRKRVLNINLERIDSELEIPKDIELYEFLDDNISDIESEVSDLSEYTDNSNPFDDEF